MHLFNNTLGAIQDQRTSSSYLLRGWPPMTSVSHDRRLSRATSAFSRVSPSGTLPGSDITAGEGAGLRANGSAQGSLEQVVWVSCRIRRDCSFTKAWSRSKDRWLSRQNLDEQTHVSEIKEWRLVWLVTVYWLLWPKNCCIFCRNLLYAVVMGHWGFVEGHLANSPGRKVWWQLEHVLTGE